MISEPPSSRPETPSLTLAKAQTLPPALLPHLLPTFAPPKPRSVGCPVARQFPSSSFYLLLRPSGSPDVVVAIVDTGADLNHPDLKGSLWVNPGEIPGNGIDDDGNGEWHRPRWDFAGC